MKYEPTPKSFQIFGCMVIKGQKSNNYANKPQAKKQMCSSKNLTKRVQKPTTKRKHKNPIKVKHSHYSYKMCTIQVSFLF